jgi:hypothetical protein
MKKNIVYIFSLSLMVLFSACNSDEEFVNPYRSEEGIANFAPFVRFEQQLPRAVDSSDFANFSIDTDMVAPSDNVTDYQLYAGLNVDFREGNIENQYDGQLVPIFQASNFPTTYTISMQSVASELGIDLSTLEVGDQINFEAEVTGNSGGSTVTISREDLTGDVNNQGIRSAVSFFIEVDEDE